MIKVQGPTPADLERVRIAAQAFSESMLALAPVALQVMRTMGEQAAVLGRAWRTVLDARMVELEKEARRREQR